MSIALLFALLMILWFLFGILPQWPSGTNTSFKPVGGNLLLFVLLLILGWAQFGPLIHK